MTRIAQRSRADLAAFEPMLQAVETAMGFVPNSFYTMAHWPDLLRTFSAFAGTVLGPSHVDPQLKQLVAYVASQSAGCRYCQAHTAHTAERRGVANAKIEAAFRFDESPLFSAAERAALRLASRAAAVPNEATQADFDALGVHFGAREIAEIVAVVSLFGFLNRWNDTMATTLEAAPAAFGAAHLQASGWGPDKHVGA